MRKIAGYIFLLLLLTSHVYAGEKLYQPSLDTAILIKSHPSGPGKFYIDIHKSGSVIKIVYAFYDSTETLKEKADTALANLRKVGSALTSFDIHKDSVLLYKITKLMGSHMVYTRDSIMLNSNVDTAYFHLFTNVVNTKDYEVKKAGGNGIHIVLDGTYFNYFIKTETGTRTAYLGAASPTDFPLLNNLVHRSLNIYREKKNDVFLDKKRTAGY